MRRRLQDRDQDRVEDLLCKQLVHPPRRTSPHLCADISETNSNWKLEQKHLGATAWIVTRAALDYAACPMCALQLCTATMIMMCTVSRRVRILETKGHCGRNNLTVLPWIQGCWPLFGANPAEARCVLDFLFEHDITGPSFVALTAWKNIDDRSSSGHDLPCSCTAPLPGTAFEDAVSMHISKHSPGPSSRGIARLYMTTT